MKITTVIITYNEEDNIKDCLESVKWTDEIIIVDSNSEDKTIKVASAYTDKIFKVDITSIVEKRKFSLGKTSNEWVLFVDADERVTPELKEEILALNPPENIAGYNINRKNYYFGKWIKHCGIYPDYHIRLFNKNKAGVNNRIIHEDVITDGETMMLKNHLLHYSVKDVSGMIKKVNFFSTFESTEHFNNGKQISRAGAFTHALATFLVMFFSRKGFKEGIAGFYVSASYSITTLFTYLKLLKLQKKI